MAITANKSPYVLTAAGDDLASVFQGRDMYDETPIVKFKCIQIRVNFGASGVCSLFDKNPTDPTAQLIFRGQAADAGGVAEASFGQGVWFDGCYVSDLPADSEVFLYVL